MSFETLNLAGSLLRASRLGMDTAGRNLAGTSEAGYTRQSMSTVSQQPSTGYNRQTLTSGLGVQVNGIQRLRQGLADQVYRARAEEAGGPQSLGPFLEDLEGRLSAHDGLQQASLDFEQAWSTLSSQPDDPALRTLAFQEGQQLAATFRQQAGAVSDVRAQAHQELGSKVERANEILSQLADLNGRIVASPGSSMGRNALLDSRDALVDELSGLMDVRVMEQPTGTVNVYQNGAELLQLKRAERLSVDGSGQVLTSSGRALSLNQGALASLQSLSTTTLDGVQAQLDALATTLRDRFNEVHQLGYGSDGVSGRDFFSGTGAADLSVTLTDSDQLGTAVARSESSAGVTVNSSQPLNGQVGVAASGTLLVNGTAINWNDGQSLDSLLGQFSSAGVRASYDTSSGRVLLARDPFVPGPSDITLSDSSGNLAAIFNLPASSSPGGSSDGAGAVALMNRLGQAVFGQAGNRSLSDGGRDLISDVGRQRSSQLAAAEATQNALTAATERRNQASGVNSDEELLQLERFQQAFQAAARVASVADETLSTLIRDLGG